MATKQDLYIKIAALSAGGFVVYKILQKLGIFPTAQEIKAETDVKNIEQAEQKNDFFSPNIKLPKGSLLLKAAAAEKLAKDLYNAHKWYNDDEEAIYNVFRQIKTRSQVSSLSKAFSQKYKQDLYFWLKNILSAKELQTVVQIINKKPKFKIS